MINALVAINTREGLFNVTKVLGSTSYDLNTSKIVVIISVYFLSFFNHAACIRYVAHVGFLINATTTPRYTVRYVPHH